MQTLSFFYFAFAVLFSSIFTVGLRNPVYCTLALLSTLLHVAGLFVLLHAEFIAAVQIIVYAGAVLVLYLFVLMLLNLKTTEMFLQKQTSIAIFFGVVILAEILIALSKSPLVGQFPDVTDESASLGNTAEVGLAIFNQYLLPFEVVGVILLGAVIGAMVLAKKIPAR